ncbi:DUF1365 domain-containing protein [Photobacterium alginatilyticum]|uniref:DUF1365 domain-containing protein n=1 Tax=Photobacterium alginatilyticum TaxID=1775171 RepID=A0ABW9YFD7_9GAMM|nr:DUF1365 domain-containing protein [Photobacterium alginatilyticum]NBI52135.1 DUF1365 domain-containing protein [Photobacterium alginatilyticum]
MNSGLYVGTVRHRRFTPVEHSFSYPMFMSLIDLDELEELQKTVKGFGKSVLNFARFRTQDFMNAPNTEQQVTDNDIQSLKQAVVAKVESLTGERVKGRVMMLCQLRYAGVYFSPLNMYYLYDEQDNWRWVLAEVSNTPWNERHYYAVPAGSSYHNPKAFHVSPFNPMSQEYHWRLKAPEKQLVVHLDIRSSDGGQNIMDATMVMKRRPFTTKVLWQLITATPVQAIKIVIGIYWQALRLWLKGAPFYNHSPSKQIPSNQEWNSK